MTRDVKQRWRVKKFEKHCSDASVKQHDVVTSRKDRMHAEYLTGFRNVQKAGYPAELKAAWPFSTFQFKISCYWKR